MALRAQDRIERHFVGRAHFDSPRNSNRLRSTFHHITGHNYQNNVEREPYDAWFDSIQLLAYHLGKHLQLGHE